MSAMGRSPTSNVLLNERPETGLMLPRLARRPDGVENGHVTERLTDYSRPAPAGTFTVK